MQGARFKLRQPAGLLRVASKQHAPAFAENCIFIHFTISCHHWTKCAYAAQSCLSSLGLEACPILPQVSGICHSVSADEFVNPLPLPPAMGAGNFVFFGQPASTYNDLKNKTSKAFKKDIYLILCKLSSARMYVYKPRVPSA